ncbi:MAG TPA: hypothetical protein VMJ10_13895 [Kofleriaceae bacterium]|nr:hypothetical protein [Kofleriaceae bacterium]
MTILASRWFPWASIVALTAIVVVLAWPRARPGTPVALPALPPVRPPPAMPTRAVPCVPGNAPILRVLDGDPVVCSDGTCLRFGADATTLVATPPEVLGPPLRAIVREVDGRWSACRDTTCRPLGPHLAAALARDPDADRAATFDLATVVAGRVAWSVAADRVVPVRGREKAITVVGNLLLVRRFESCTDRSCLQSQLVDGTGRELGEVEAGGDVIALDDHRIVAISEFSALQVRDLARGTLLVAFDPDARVADFIAAARIDADHVALLRDAYDGVRVSVIEVLDRQLVIDAERFVPGC